MTFRDPCFRQFVVQTDKISVHDYLLKNDIPEFLIASFLQNQSFRINAQRKKSGSYLKPGDKLVLYFHVSEPEVPEEIKIIFQNETLVVVDKLSAQVVHPGGEYVKHSLQSQIQSKYGQGWHALHRLDRETSGIVLFVKGKKAFNEWSRTLQQASKQYLALVNGNTPEHFSVGLSLQKTRSSLVKLRLHPHAEGKVSRSTFQRIAGNGQYSLLKVDLLTGVQHQIRAHCSAMGHPIVGDKIYGEDESMFIRSLDGKLSEEDKKKLILPYQALHAHKIEIRDPLTSEIKCFSSAMPEAWRAIINSDLA